MTNNLLLDEQLTKTSEINYDGDDVLAQQRLGAIAVNQLVRNFSKATHENDLELIAFVLVRLKDLQVRDYAMGLVTEENIDQQFNLWYWLMNMAPNGYIAPVACIFAACAYESGESDLAHKALDNAFADQISYPLAVLLRRVFFSGWPAQSFAAMRAQRITESSTSFSADSRTARGTLSPAWARARARGPSSSASVRVWGRPSPRTAL